MREASSLQRAQVGDQRVELLVGEGDLRHLGIRRLSARYDPAKSRPSIAAGGVELFVIGPPSNIDDVLANGVVGRFGVQCRCPKDLHGLLAGSGLPG
jgi:hypothetical protein